MLVAALGILWTGLLDKQLDQRADTTVQVLFREAYFLHTGLHVALLSCIVVVQQLEAVQVDRSSLFLGVLLVLDLLDLKLKVGLGYLVFVESPAS